VSSFYFSPNASGDATVGGTWVQYSQALVTVPTACTFDSLYVNASAVPSGLGVGGSITITLSVNNALSALTITVNNGGGSAAGNITGGSVSVNAGDTIALQASGGGISSGQGTISSTLHCR